MFSSSVSASIFTALISLLLVQDPFNPTGNSPKPAKSTNTWLVRETQSADYQASLLNVSPDGLELQLPSERRTVPWDQLLRVENQSQLEKKEKEKKVAAKDLVTVELRDGSIVYGSQITATDSTATLERGDEKPIDIKNNRIQSVQLQPLVDELKTQWQAIVESSTVSDTLILRRSELALDKIEGVISGVSNTQVKFQYDGQTIDVQRTKLAGWKYFAVEQSTRPKLLAVVRDRWGSTWMAQAIQKDETASEPALKILLVCEAAVTLPLSRLSEIDFSYGSMRFLADLPAIERKVKQRFNLATQLPEAETLFGPRPSAAETQRGATVGPGVEFMGSGTVVYRVPDGFRRMFGTVILNPDGPQFVTCTAVVMVEDKVVWEKVLDKPHEAIPLDVEVEPGKRVRLTVSTDSKQPVGDRVTWRQLRFIKVK